MLKIRESYFIGYSDSEKKHHLCLPNLKATPHKIYRDWLGLVVVQKIHW